MKLFALLPLGGFVLSSFFLVNNRKSIEVEYAHAHLKKYSSGALAGYTGAPGEQNCTQCHGGAVQDGSNENLFSIRQNGVDVTEYLPGETYELSLNLFSDPAKKGFEVTVLDSDNNFAGQFTVGPNTQIKTGGGRKYVTHTGSGNAPSGWTWSWTAPDDIAGELRFYIATNKANGNGTSTGDMIYLSQAALNTSAGVDETGYFSEFVVGYSSESKTLDMDFTALGSGQLTLNVVDLSGKSVFYQHLGTSVNGDNSQSIRLPEHIRNGMYVVHIMVDNNTASQQVLIH